MALSAVLTAAGLMLVEYGLPRVEVAHPVLHHQDGHRRPPAFLWDSSDRTRAAPPGQLVADRGSPLAEHVRPRWPTTIRIVDPAPLQRRPPRTPSAPTACHQ